MFISLTMTLTPKLLKGCGSSTFLLLGRSCLPELPPWRNIDRTCLQSVFHAYCSGICAACARSWKCLSASVLSVRAAKLTVSYVVVYDGNRCPACKSLAPVWDQLAVKLEGKVNVAKVGSGFLLRFSSRSWSTQTISEVLPWEQRTSERCTISTSQVLLCLRCTGGARPRPRLIPEILRGREGFRLKSQ